MNKTLLKTSIISIIALGLLAIGNIALADTVTGTLTTGLNATVGTTMNGVVIAPPIANPPAGAYTSTLNVTLTADGASSIHYTINNTAPPTCSTGTIYSGAISVSLSIVIEAISCYSNSASSTVAAYQYAINPPSDISATVVTSSGGGGGGSSGGGSGSSLFSKGDSNLDGRINILDFVALMANWGHTGAGNAADFNGDGRVDILDFVILMANWTN